MLAPGAAGVQSGTVLTLSEGTARVRAAVMDGQQLPQEVLYRWP
jgi:hypothetical protein